MLHLNHTLPINADLSIEQIWAGLMLRVTEQTRFTVGLDRVELLEQSANDYRRALHFGAHVVYDRVHCEPLESVEFTTDATPDLPSGRLCIRLLGASHLRLNFEYETAFPEPATDEERSLLEMIKSAYIAADADMIRIIIEWAKQ